MADGARVYIDTVGCYKNVEDSERAAGLLEARGHVIVATPEEADVIVVNTCGFIEDAKRESIDRILELAEHRERGAKLVVSGCLSQRYPDEIFEEIPEADAVIGVNDYGRLPDILCNIHGEANERRIRVTDGIPSVLTGGRHILTPGATAYLKVAEGCDNRCAYCAIPMIRGPYRSVPMEALVGEAALLTRAGARELVLIAQDVSAYGSDIYGRYALPGLLEKLAHPDGDEDAPAWIRLMYCYEERVTDELIDAIARIGNVCNYLDIPLQHVSDGVLARMGRRSTRKSIERTIDSLHAAIPDIAIRTTFMTGFPGETDDDFAELADFVAERRFERLGVFAFSPEDGTRAAGMDDQIPRELAEERRDALMARQVDISLETNRKWIGRELAVLVEGAEDETTFVGRSEYDAPEIDGEVVFSSPSPVSVGSFARVRITDAMDYDLVGETP
ncbi:MAG: 30S ribosomal protein S12 methylthiotransferase RimO [Clostridiales Family XIII bacterium]|jgi:ribosomal protein S12 methylthiotransferase|nr:30S ribosomal protein S12 methylthiotransferase RimO [Clostridiales Family XIII bacterium]